MKRVVAGGNYCGTEVAKAIRRGQLRRPSEFPCAGCGGPAIEYDHRDYNLPLVVEPVCRSCNLRRGPAIPRLWPNREALLATLKRHVTGDKWRIVPWAVEWCMDRITCRCAAIETATGGKVTRHELRPDLYPREQAA